MQGVTTCSTHSGQNKKEHSSRVDELLDRLGKANFISTMDLTRGYWQVSVAEQDRHKTAFNSPVGFFQFRVMPFGLQPSKG